MNIMVRIFFQVESFIISEYMPRSGTDGSYGSFIPNFQNERKQLQIKQRICLQNVQATHSCSSIQEKQPLSEIQLL